MLSATNPLRNAWPEFRSLVALVAVALAGCSLACGGDSSGATTIEPVPPQVGPPPVFGAAVTAARQAAPLIGGTLLILADDRTAVAADPDRDAVYVVDYRRQKLLGTVTLDKGDEPGRLVADDQGRVHVALRRGGAVVTLDPATWSVAARRPVCAAPRGLAFDAGQGNLLHVACAEGLLVTLPAAPDGAVTRRLELDSDLRDVVVEGDVLRVSRFRSAEVLTVGRDGKVSDRLTLPAREATRKTMTAGDGKSAAGGETITHMEPSVAWRMLGVPGGPTVMVHQRATNTRVETQRGGYGGELCGSIVESAVSVVSPGQPASSGLMGVVLPIDMAVSPDREWMAVLSSGNAHNPMNTFGQLQVMVADAIHGGKGGDCGFPAPPVTLSPKMPHVVAALPDDVLVQRPMVVNQPTGEATAVAIDGTGHVLVQTREPSTLQIVTAETLAPLPLGTQSMLDTGHAIFHANTGADLACASCHPEGGDDGRVWLFSPKPTLPAELRRTQNLRGGIGVTAPFHWEGDLADIDALMREVFVSRMQGPELTGAQLKSLRAWLDGVPLLPRRPVTDAAAVERGRALFNDAGAACATCHAGPGDTFTNNTTHEVGTGKPFQVPSLRGLHYRAPYMHDGCAGTLADRFRPSCGGGDRHGVTSKLTAEQIGDLTAYLESL